MNFSERLFKLRKNLNLKQSQFAEPLGIDRSYVAALEKGSRQPSETLIKFISLQYGVPVTWLKTGEGEMFISPEEAIRNQMARFGKQAIIEAFTGFMKEHDLAVVNSRPGSHHTGVGTGDPTFDHMISTIYDLWAAADEDMKGWIKIQLRRAIPDDVIEEAQKKQKGTQEQASAS